MRNVTQPIRFQGQWSDEESGLYYNRHRYYDPQQGRYISQYPIGLNGGTNLYGYVTNPTEMVNPLGLYGVLGADVSHFPRYNGEYTLGILMRTEADMEKRKSHWCR